MTYSAFQPQTHRPSGQGLGLCSIHCPQASRLGREGYAARCLMQPRPSSRVEGAAPLSRPLSNAAARWVKKPLMRIRGARGRRCGGPVLGPSCLMYTWPHAGSPVGASPAACEPYPVCALRKYHHQWAVHGGRGGRNLSCLARAECSWNGRSDGKASQWQSPPPQIPKGTRGT